MTTDALSRHRHPHNFHQTSDHAERSTRLVMWITLVAMVMEIGAGWWFNSMALLADGWHMSSHALAIGLSAMAYAASRRLARDHRFAFGPWKVEVLAGFASAILLLGVAALMVAGSVERIISPQAIQHREAVAVAVIGLAVNLLCAFILGHAHHGHGHGHSHEHHAHDHHHGHGHDHHEDLNLKSAYLHVIADAATSVLAIAALLGGWFLGWDWLDPVMGIVGAVLVATWARGLLRQTSAVLLDREMDHPVVQEIREVVEQGPTRLADLHVWRVGREAYAGAFTVVTPDRGVTADSLRQALAIHEEIAHLTIEVHHTA